MPVIAERIAEFRTALEDACAERSERSAHATGLFCDSIPNVYDFNYLRADEPLAAASELVGEADALMPAFLHRKVVAGRDAEQVAAAFSEQGFTITQHVVMAHLREPDRRIDTSAVRELDFDQLVTARTEVTLAETHGDLELSRNLDWSTRLVMAAVPTRFFAAFVDGRIAAYCELRGRGSIAQLENVNTLPAFRGRGLGRAVVQHALDGRRTHSELVYLEALGDDWPRQLYAKLGFDVVDERYLFLKPGHALTRLRLRTPRLELRLATQAELRALAEVARAGIHDPAAMPFYVPWTDGSDRPGFVDEFIEHNDAALRNWSADNWSLVLVAFADGQPVGVQSIRGDRFSENRTVDTGSWLGRSWQGRGLGIELRAAVLSLAFDGLGALRATSGSIGGNLQSLGVSRKLGYRETGTKTVAPRGVPVEELLLELHSDEFVSPVPVEITGLDGLHSQFGIDKLA